MTGAIRYSRVPATSIKELALVQCTTEAPVFFDDSFSLPGRGVLRPDAPPAILFGAEDRGEVGAYHHGRQGRPVRIPLADEEEMSFTAEFRLCFERLLFEGRVR